MKMIVHKELRLRLKPLTRYIATPETARRCFFSFVDADVMPDNTLVVVPAAALLGILSSQIHKTWALASGSRKGAGGDSVYVKSRCFDTFPFPDTTDEQKNRIRNTAEQLDAHRKTQQAAFLQLTLTALYGVLEKSRSGVPLSAKDFKITNEVGQQEYSVTTTGLKPQCLSGLTKTYLKLQKKNLDASTLVKGEGKVDEKGEF